MCELQLCLQLRESLSAAFRGGVYEGADYIGAWGRAVVEGLQDQKCPHTRSLILNIIHDSFLSIMMNCPCEGLAENLLRSPETFVRTALILACRHISSEGPDLPVVLH